MKHQNHQIVYLSDMPNGGSDITLKHNIKVLENVLNKVLALRPVTWRWKGGVNHHLNYGFIAQEVEEIMPDLVSEGNWKNGERVKFLSTKGLVPYAISAIKEQHQQISKLTILVEKQQRAIAELKHMVEDLKKKSKKA